MSARDRYITIRASAEEAAMLHELAEAKGISASDYVRMFIRDAHAERAAALQGFETIDGARLDALRTQVSSNLERHTQKQPARRRAARRGGR
jgi:hypothetical protein